jgi:hypothetical protein
MAQQVSQNAQKFDQEDLFQKANSMADSIALCELTQKAIFAAIMA